MPDDEGRPVAVQVTEERLRHMLAKLAIWQRAVRKNELVPAHPPTAQVKCLLATPDPGLPVLAGIVTTPVFGRGGTLLTEPGYHPDARLLYHAAPGFEVPPIPERPTDEEIAAARSLILDDLLGDFPFTSLAERAHAVALLLLGFVRAMIDGPTPLHLIEKPTPGTGATLMVDAIATIITGAGASVMTEGRDEEEWRKRVTAKLRQIPSLVLIDNLRRTLDSSALAAALTAPFWEDRVLGHSEMTRLPIRCAWIATGNNPDFSNEMARRLVRIRLDARVEQPWQRDSFRHPDLMGWVRANRGRLVAACLTLVRTWIAAGRPRGSRSIGSYESWAQTLGGVLDVAGIEGFLGNLEEMMKASDKEGASWRGFVSMWWDRFGTAEVGTADLYEVATSCEPPLDLGSGTDRALRTRFGKRIGKIRDRVFQLDRFSVRAETAGVLHQAQRWRLVLADDPTPVGTAACGETATDERSQRSHATDQGGNVGNVGGNVAGQRSHNFSFAEQQAGERWERGERVSNPYACAPARTHVKETPDQRSPRSQPSQNAEETMSCSWERSGERRNAPSHVPNPPDWLKEVL